MAIQRQQQIKVSSWEALITLTNLLSPLISQEWLRSEQSFFYFLHPHCGKKYSYNKTCLDFLKVTEHLLEQIHPSTTDEADHDENPIGFAVFASKMVKRLTADHIVLFVHFNQHFAFDKIKEKLVVSNKKGKFIVKK